MKHLIRLLLLACTFSMSAYAAQTRYISDNLFTYMHAGPGTQYRIVGSVNAGAKVSMHERSGKYIRITDARGRNGWVQGDFISQTPGLKDRLPALEQELADTKSQLENAQATANEHQSALNTELSDSQTQVSELQEANDLLTKQLTAAETEMRSMRSKLDKQQNDLLMKWFLRGGVVAGIGLLLGLLLPSMMPRKRKKAGGWA
uniref:TIGR04211 family SH3 domain-containing protein n=1 Tax=Thaumasiovibrio occultus TaxID=1891184 RepID=UPI000B3519B8|nr:TIGR04211 family SH3 domain-containing protein [Thaumasiovibrio occultus]